MDTKSTNNHKKWGVLTALVILTASVAMVLCYPLFKSTVEKNEQRLQETYFPGIFSPLADGNYILYNELSKETDSSEILAESGNSQFNLLIRYMDYAVYDSASSILLESREHAGTWLTDKADGNYMTVIEFVFDSNSKLSSVHVAGNTISKATQYDIERELFENSEHSHKFSTPADITIRYGITRENFTSYFQEEKSIAAMYLMNEPVFVCFYLAFALAVVVLACLIPLRPKSAYTEERQEGFSTFHAPLELVVISLALVYMLSLQVSKMVYASLDYRWIQVVSEENSIWNMVVTIALNLIVWVAVFSVFYWAAVCLKEMVLRKKAYFRDRSLIVQLFLSIKNQGNTVKKGTGTLWDKCKKFFYRQYDILLHMDFRDRTNFTIIRIVVINFLILLLLYVVFGLTGIWVLVLYTVGLFIFLKKYLNKIQEQYQGILNSTNQLAEGNLDAPIEGDVGVFTPVQQELRKIQSGFKKAVEEETKSERMKADLITNVSHDLKTPLTAIITYVDLLKSERDSEKREEYLDVLEKKSLRLKVLIEDLFEISKATSKTVNLHFMKVDIINLLKQVGLEYEENLKRTELNMKWNFPEEKIYLWLDSEKTYRIFENLIVNISKYALPHTRVYISVSKCESDICITMKNISAAELNFNTEEITDRFVRGDSSRNTEGSGLGLAIAKSFTELQHGKLKILTDADLFKVEITFPKWEESKKIKTDYED